MACLTTIQLEKLPETTRVLELGCGQIKRWPHSVTIDINPRSLADVIHDLNATPYPFPDNGFDLIIGEHVLEHLDDLIKVMEELHRITKPGGMLYIEVPHFSSANFYTDITHRHSFTTRSFDYFIPDTDLSKFRYSTATFRKHFVALNKTNEMGPVLRRRLNGWINRHLVGYERNLAFMLPSESINFELEVLK